jgi:hypothetical protein
MTNWVHLAHDTHEAISSPWCRQNRSLVTHFSLRSSRRQKSTSLSRNHRRWSKIWPNMGEIQPNGPIIQTPVTAGAA